MDFIFIFIFFKERKIKTERNKPQTRITCTTAQNQNCLSKTDMANFSTSQLHNQYMF